MADDGCNWITGEGCEDRWVEMEKRALKATAPGSKVGWSSTAPQGSDIQYAKGGPVVKVGYKHDNPNHLNFGKSADSALLAKGFKP